MGTLPHNYAFKEILHKNLKNIKFQYEEFKYYHKL